VKERDAFWAMKQAHQTHNTGKYEDIHVPKNSPLGFFVGIFAFCLSFGTIWYMWWLAAVGMIGIIVCVTIRLCDDDVERVMSAHEVQHIETARTRA